MNKTMRLLAGIVLSVVLAFAGGVAMACLSDWLDKSFNQSRLNLGSLGFALYIPLLLGALAGLVTVPVFLTTDHEFKGRYSTVVGATSCVICLLSLATTNIVPYRPHHAKSPLIIIGPTTLWMLLLFLYGIWLLCTRKVNRD